MHPKISVIIPTLNEEKYLPRLLKSLKMQDFKEYEIIVVDGHSEDRTAEIASKLGARVIESEIRGIGYQRHLGAEKSRGKLLIFIDSDVYLTDKGFLSKAWEYFQRGFLHGTFFGMYYEFTGNQMIDYIFSKVRFLWQKLARYYGGACIFVERNLYFSVGGFKNEPFEDKKFSKRLYAVSKKLNFFDRPTFHVSGRRFRKTFILGALLVTVFMGLLEILKPVLPRSILGVVLRKYERFIQHWR